MAAMTWQTHWGLIKPRAELLDATGKTIGSIEWMKWTGTLASANVADRRWSFKRVGFLQTRVVVRTDKSDQDLAVFHPTWISTGQLILASGKSYQLHSKGLMQAHKYWTMTGSPERLVQYQITSWLSNSKADVEMTTAIGTDHDSDLLLMLGWYLQVMANQDAAIIGGAAS